MSSAQNVPALLRFLSQEAKIPLAQAMSKIPALQAAHLNTALDLSKADFATVQEIFGDEKTARQCLNAAKRVSKKRSADQADPTALASPPGKRTKPTIHGQPLSGAALEASLSLPPPGMDENILRATVLYTNRAPLVLAFAVTLLKYTMPAQPVSSRLSLAQAVTSMNSKTKAVHIGLEKGRAEEEEEGWGTGQPLVRVMTREIRVMKRWGYVWEEDESEAGTQETVEAEPETLGEEREPALWGVDLEALKKANQPGVPKSGRDNLPIYSAQSARAYLLRAFEKPPVKEVKQEGDTAAKTKAKRSVASIAAEKERNLGLLLGALELLYRSWATILSREELDRRAWACYVCVRPEVAQGAAGWGGKGNVNLADILDLRRASGG